MRKKLTKALALLIATCTFLTGCQVPFLNKEEPINPTPEVESVDASQYLTISGDVEFELNESVPFESVVTYVEGAPSVLQYGFILADGNYSTSLPTDKEGDQTVDIIVEFDNSYYQEKFTYKVESKLFPDYLISSIEENEWETGSVKITRLNESMEADIIGEITISQAKDKFNFISYTGGLEDGMNWNIYTINNDDEIQMHNFNMSYLRDPIAVTSVFALIEMFAGAAGELSAEDQKALDNMMYLKQYMLEGCSVEQVSTDYSVYDIDGKSYPVSAVKTKLIGSKFGTADVESIQCFYITYDENSKMLFIPTETYSFESTEEDVTVESGNEAVEEDMPLFDSYEEFKVYIESNLQHTEQYIPEDTNNVRLDDFSDIANYFIIGDVPVWKNSQKEKEEPAQETPETEITVDEQQEDKAQEEVSNEVTSIEGSYRNKYEHIYHWDDGDDNTYRRWKYLIDVDGFSGTIIQPDGTYLMGESTLDIFGDNGTTVTDKNNYGGEVYVLTSAYASYTVSNANMPEIKFIPEESTTGKLAMWYGNNKYYLQIARATQINNYTSNCIYSTADMRNAEFKVDKDGAGLDADYGVITNYSISYTNTVGTKKVNPYMSVYSLGEDYIVAYGDNLIESGSTLLYDMLSKMVIEN